MVVITKTIDITVTISIAPGKLVHRHDLRCTDFEVTCSTLAVEWVLAIVAVTVVVASDVDGMMVVVAVGSVMLWQ